ncbi:hypothetical protein R6Q57_014386 [Mikania cordata]
MADVMQGRGHGGDGAEDPPPPGGFGRGHHEADFGELSDWFTGEVGIYMWEHIAFDKTSWKYVSSAEKNALYEHLKCSKKGGIEATLLKRYRDRKAMAKQYFIKNGGYDGEERARANPPEGMYAENWKKAVDFFLSDTHKKRSSSNAENDLKAEFQNQIGPNSDGEFDEESSASHPNEVAVFEKVMGVRRGHTRGIGRKPSISDGSSSFVSHQEQQMRPSGLTQDQIAGLFKDPGFMEQLSHFIDLKNKKANTNDEDDSDEADE